MRKFLWLVLPVTLLTLCLLTAGCAKKEPERIRLIAVGWNIAAESFVKQAAAFEKMHPNVKIDVRFVDQDYTRIMPRLAAGTPVPDIMMVHGRDMITFVHKYPNMIRDITAETAPLRDNFVTAAWDAVTVNGKIYGIPADLGPAVLFYRADLWQEAGIDPKSIETWDDLIRAGKKLSQHFNGQVAMLGMCEDTDFYDQILNELGGNYVSSDDKTIVINSFAAKQAMTIVSRMLEEGTLINAKNWDGLMSAMSEGKIAAVAYGVWFSGTLEWAVPEQKGKWKAMPLPAATRGGSHVANSGGSIAAIYKNSPHPKEAWEFLQFCFNTEEGELLQATCGLFPAYKPIYTHPEFQKPDPYIGTPLKAEFSRSVEELKPLRRGPITLDTGKAINDLMATVTSGGNPQAALDKAAVDIAAATGLAVR